MTGAASNDAGCPHSFVRVRGLKPVTLPHHLAVKQGIAGAGR
jgi:hypothetical protein